MEDLIDNIDIASTITGGHKEKAISSQLKRTRAMRQGLLDAWIATTGMSKSTNKLSLHTYHLGDQHNVVQGFRQPNTTQHTVGTNTDLGENAQTQSQDVIDRSLNTTDSSENRQVSNRIDERRPLLQSERIFSHPKCALKVILVATLMFIVVLVLIGLVLFLVNGVIFHQINFKPV